MENPIGVFQPEAEGVGSLWAGPKARCAGEARGKGVGRPQRGRCAEGAVHTISMRAGAVHGLSMPEQWAGGGSRSAGGPVTSLWVEGEIHSVRLANQCKD